MKTPWHSLLQYGTATAALIVISISTVLLMAVVVVGIVLSKLSVIIR